MNFRAPPSLHEAEVERHFPRDPTTRAQLPDDDIRALAGAMATARRHAEQVVELAAALQNDGTRTPQAAALELRKAALGLGEKAARSLDAARQRASESLRRVEAETAAPPPPRDAVALQIEGEVRARVSQLSASERRKALSAALEGGDDAIVGAVLRGPAMLSGMDQPELDHLRARWRQARHPEKAAKIDHLSRAIEAADRGGQLLVGFVENVANSATAKGAAAQAGATDAILNRMEAAE